MGRSELESPSRHSTCAFIDVFSDLAAVERDPRPSDGSTQTPPSLHRTIREYAEEIWTVKAVNPL